MLELLEQLFRQVRSYAQSERFDRNNIYEQTSRHTTMQFDRDAEDLIIKGLIESNIGFEIITEERPMLQTVPNPPYRIVVDPIDGSTNVERGIMTAGVSLAVLPIDAPIMPEQVQWAFVGELSSGTVYEAQKGRGSFREGRRCQVSGAKTLRGCLAGMNLDGRAKNVAKALLTQSPALGHVRRTGSSAVDCVYVASGTYDVYVDVGNILTGESFLAAAAIVLEAGGIVTDQEGKPLRPIQTLEDKFSLIAACSRELHQEILTRIKGPN